MKSLFDFIAVLLGAHCCSQVELGDSRFDGEGATDDFMAERNQPGAL